MAEKAVPRVVRLLGIVAHLDEHGEATFEELAEHFGVTAETITRDIDTLWVSGLPGYGPTELLDFDGWAFEQGIARLVTGQGLSQTRLSAGEAFALIGALSSMIASGAAPPEAQTVLDRLSEAVHQTAPVDVRSRQQVNVDVRAALEDGIERSMATAITYVDANDRRSERVIEPHRLVTIDGIGYIEAFCRKADGARTLRLDRIEKAELTESPASAPRINRDGFDLESAYNADIRLDLWARWIVEDLPGATVDVTDTSVRARFGVANVDVIVARLLSVAPAIQSLEPQQLREALADAADRVLAAHGESR